MWARSATTATCGHEALHSRPCAAAACLLPLLPLLLLPPPLLPVCCHCCRYCCCRHGTWLQGLLKLVKPLWCVIVSACVQYDVCSAGELDCLHVGTSFESSPRPVFAAAVCQPGACAVGPGHGSGLSLRSLTPLQACSTAVRGTALKGPDY